MSYRLQKTFIYILGRVPLPLLYTLAYITGTVLYWLPLRIVSPKRNSLININQCFPDLSQAKRKTLLRQSLIETCKTLVELPYTWAHSSEHAFTRVKELHHFERLEAAAASDKGVLILSPHLANWEMLSCVISRIFQATAMYQPGKNQALDDIALNSRRTSGTDIIPTNAKGVKAALKLIRRGEILVMFADHQPGNDNNPFIDFFGIPALTSKFLHQLVKRTGCTVLCTSVTRQNQRGDYHFYVDEAPEEVYSLDETTSLTAMHKMLEKAILRAPEQYGWYYKRFARRPQGQPAFYSEKFIQPGSYLRELKRLNTHQEDGSEATGSG